MIEQRRKDWLLLGGLTLLTFLLHLAFYKGYGFFRDELQLLRLSTFIGLLLQKSEASIIFQPLSNHNPRKRLFRPQFASTLCRASGPTGGTFNANTPRQLFLDGRFTSYMPV